MTGERERKQIQQIPEYGPVLLLTREKKKKYSQYVI